MPKSLQQSSISQQAAVGGAVQAHDPQYWHCITSVDKFHGDPTFEERESGLAVPYESITVEGNLLVIGGASVQWQTLIGNGTTTAGQALTYYNNANAAIGVGDSTTAAADTQTDLQAATNKLRRAMEATYPLHTDTTGTAGSKSVTYRSSFATGDANWVWNEWGLFNSPTAATGRMLNRKVESLGTKTSSATWVITVTLSLA